MKIREVKRYSGRVFSEVQRLLPQLDPDSAMISAGKFRSILKSENTHLFVAEDENGEITGMLTAVVYFTPTGIKFWIEDVVVDESFRGKGIGKELMFYALEFAKSTGAISVELTSRPSRVSANKLYQQMGFILRETNVYRYPLK